MMLDAYGLSLIAVLGALSVAVLRSQALRPRLSTTAVIVAAFFLGYVADGRSHHGTAAWSRGTPIQAPAQRVGSEAGETLAVFVPGSSDQKLRIKRGDQISTDIFDAATAGVLASHTELHMPAGTKLQVSGWAADSDKGVPCKAMYLVVDERRFALPYGFARTDVAAYFHSDALTLTGYSAQLATDHLAKGSHAMVFECVSADGKTLFVATQKHTVVIE